MSTTTLSGCHSITDTEPGIPQIEWPAAPAAPELTAGQVHLFCAALPEFKSQIEQFKRLLSRAEIERAGRFHFAKDRNAYVVCHALERLILGRYASAAPAEIEFEYGEFGKPALKSRAALLHFNQSHSCGMALFGVTTHGPIGVDIECMRPIPEFDEIAERYFCGPEVAAMRALTEDRRMKAFYSCWTSKEAYLKATGEGIAEKLNRVEVALDSSLQAQALRLPDDSPDSKWELRAFSPAAGYAGAVAMNGVISSLRMWRLGPSSFNSL